MQDTEILYFRQEINQCCGGDCCGADLDSWQIEVYSDGSRVSTQKIPAASSGFGFAANEGAEVNILVTPFYSGRPGDSFTRSFLATEELDVVDHPSLGKLTIERKHVLQGV